MDRSPSLRIIAGDIGVCLGFYTRLPTGWLPAGDRRLADAHWAAPVAGAVIGLAGGITFWVATSLGLSVAIAAALALAATMAITGCLHEDGLADVADGFGGGATRESKLEIMRDSRIGAYGVAVLVITLLLRWSAIAALASPALVFFALIVAHAASRSFLPAFMAMVPPARSDGLSAGAGATDMSIAAAAAILGTIALLIFLGIDAGIAAALCLGFWFLTLRRLCERQIGGQTGDVLGTLQQGGEVIILLVASIFLI